MRLSRNESSTRLLCAAGKRPVDAIAAPESGPRAQPPRTTIARRFEPQVLLLDEPVSNLDARLRRRVRSQICELQQRPRFTAVYATHDQDEALAFSDRIVVMKDGGIAQESAPRDLYEAPASAFITDFMGEANVAACDIIAVKVTTR